MIEVLVPVFSPGLVPYRSRLRADIFNHNRRRWNDDAACVRARNIRPRLDFRSKRRLPPRSHENGSLPGEKTGTFSDDGRLRDIVARFCAGQYLRPDAGHLPGQFVPPNASMPTARSPSRKASSMWLPDRLSAAPSRARFPPWSANWLCPGMGDRTTVAAVIPAYFEKTRCRRGPSLPCATRSRLVVTRLTMRRGRARSAGSEVIVHRRISAKVNRSGRASSLAGSQRLYAGVSRRRPASSGRDPAFLEAASSTRAELLIAPYAGFARVAVGSRLTIVT